MGNLKLVKIVKNFITNEEIDELNNWTLKNYQKPYFSDPQMNDDDIQTRFTTRNFYNGCEEYQDYKFQYPKKAYDIQTRLLTYLKLKKNSIIPWPFTDGIVSAIAFSPGSCLKHKDPIYFKNTYTLHCNFVTQKPKNGGITYIEGIPYEFKKNDMIMYITSHLNHEVTEISGDIPRILWIYGFCVDLLELNNIFKIPNISYQ